MISNIRYKYSIIVGLFFLFAFAACELDYENKGSITPEGVWKNKKMINALLNDIHGASMPGWSFNGADSDEGIAKKKEMSEYLRGIISTEKTTSDLKGRYERIERANFFLYHLEGVEESVLTAVEKERMAAQAMFWRAWQYWDAVRAVGGVPLILQPQDLLNKESLFIPRNSTTECMEQIIKDLDYAIRVLPDVWTGDDYGRIDKCAALAFKGRVQLWYASPLFNPSNDKKRWEDAYNTNQSALTLLQSNGKGLYPVYSKLWDDEQNKEVIMVKQYYYPGHTYYLEMRPQVLGGTDKNQPYYPLLMAYPKKDGSPLQLDLNKLATDMDYNKAFIDDFYTNRDDRFLASVFCGGQIYPADDPDFIPKNTRFWTTWVHYKNSVYTSLAMHQLQGGDVSLSTGFMQMKGSDAKLNRTITGRAERDWVEIRFAEVLMNFGECANELNKKDEALQVLYDIRKRAEILKGSGNYGITASSQDEIREAYINERFVEFAFENKRMGDLRRLKRYDILNSHKHRAALYTVLTDKADIAGFNFEDDIIDNVEARRKFHMVYIPNIDEEDQYKFNLSLNHWFYALSVGDLNSNSKLEQNNEWGGTFDPLK